MQARSRSAALANSREGQGVSKWSAGPQRLRANKQDLPKVGRPPASEDHPGAWCRQANRTSAALSRTARTEVNSRSEALVSEQTEPRVCQHSAGRSVSKQAVGPRRRRASKASAVSPSSRNDRSESAGARKVTAGSGQVRRSCGVSMQGRDDSKLVAGSWHQQASE